MRYGDWLIKGTNIILGMERTTNSGLLADINSGRMVDKLEGCSREYDIVHLLIEGLILPAKDGNCLVQYNSFNFKYYPLHNSPFDEGANLHMMFRKHNFRYSRFAEFMTSVSLRWIHKIEWTLDTRDTAERILSLEKYLLKPDHNLHLAKSRPFSMLSREKRIGEYVISDFPGIGPEKARALLLHFGSIQGVINAGEKGLRDVAGIGKLTAQRFYNECRKQYDQD